MKHTNNKLPTQVVRYRLCKACGFKWFTVETRVPDYTVGWAASMQSKPVLRVPVTVTLQHVEEPDMRQILRVTGGNRMKNCDSAAA